MSNETKKIKVTLVKSPIGFHRKQGLIAKALGLGKLGSSAEHVDIPTIRGMINKIPHLVSVTEA